MKGCSGLIHLDQNTPTLLQSRYSGLIHLDQNTPTLYCNERLQWFNTPGPQHNHTLLQ